MRSKSRKSRHNCMKFYSHKRKIIKKETVCGILIKHFYSQVINIFEEVLNQNYGENIFFVIKPKRKPKLRHTFLDFRQTFDLA